MGKMIFAGFFLFCLLLWGCDRKDFVFITRRAAHNKRSDCG